MTGAELLAEGRRLARPCTLLKSQGDTYAAVWRGQNPFTPLEPDLEHWISVDRSLLSGGLIPAAHRRRIQVRFLRSCRLALQQPVGARLDALVNEALVLTTSADSEPWVEVWKLPQGYRVIPRIT